MASIRREIHIEACPEVVWEALRDVGAIHRRLAPGFVRDVRLENGSRFVTFGNGLVVREDIVSVDEASRRVVWSAVGTAMTHHNASAQVFAEGDGCRFVWIADLLPDAVAPTIAGMIEQGLTAIARHLGRGAAGEAQSTDPVRI